MYGCILIPPEMSLVFALEPPKHIDDNSTSPSSSPPITSSSPQKQPQQNVVANAPSCGDKDSKTSIRSSLLANTALSPGTMFYPDDGDIRLERIADNTIMAQDDIRRVFGGYDVMLKVDGQEVRHCNWVRFVKSSDDPETANIICSKGRGQIQYYQVVRPIKINHELVVYFKTTTERSNPRHHNIHSSIMPTNFQSFDPSMFYPRPSYPFSQPEQLQQLQQQHQQKQQQQQQQQQEFNIRSSNSGLNSPFPAILLRHYDKMMTSTPIAMKNDVKNASQHGNEDTTTKKITTNQSQIQRIPNTDELSHHHQRPSSPYYPHQQFKTIPIDSSSILSNISLSSSFSSSPMTKPPHSPPIQTDGVDYTISKNPTPKKFENSLSSPAPLTPSSLSCDNEKLTFDSSHSIKVEYDDEDGNNDDVNRCDNNVDDNVETSEEDSRRSSNKSDNNEGVENSIVKQESEDDNENVSFVHESRGIKDNNTTTDDTEDDVNVDVDSTGVDMSIHYENDNENNSDDNAVMMKSEDVQNIISREDDFRNIRGDRMTKEFSVNTMNMGRSSLTGIESNTLNDLNSGSRLNYNVGRSESQRECKRFDDITSEQQITSSTTFAPVMKNSILPKMDASDSTDVFDGSHGSTSSQSQPLDCSTDKIMHTSPSNEELFISIKPEMIVSGFPSSDSSTLMTSRDAKPMKRCRERSWWPCEMCGKKFDRPSLLKRHIRTHTGEKPHACDVCGKAFSTSSSLNTHRRIHSGEKPHQCKVCGKRFTASSNLYYHRMTHNKEKPHKCTLCSKSFPTPGDLRSHQYIHSGSWPFRCHVCNRGFSKQTNLRNHMMLHSGDKPHECSRCGKKFALLCNLKTHFKTHDSSDSSDVTDGSKCDDSTEDIAAHHQDRYKDNRCFPNSFEDNSDNRKLNQLNANFLNKNNTKFNNISSERSASLKRKHSQTDSLPKEMYTTYRYNDPGQNPQKSKRHTDFSISRITSSDDKPSKHSSNDVIAKESEPPSIRKDIETDASNANEILNSAANASLAYPLMYKHLMAAATASQQQQQLQQQQQQQQQLLQSHPDLHQLHQQHQQWLLSQQAYNKMNVFPFHPVPFHPASFTTPGAFHKSNLFPIPPPAPPSSSSSPSPFNNVSDESNLPPSSSSLSSSSPFTTSAKLIGSNAMQFTPTATPTLAPVPVFYKPDMMSLNGGGAFMSRIPTMPPLPAFWGSHMTANGF